MKHYHLKNQDKTIEHLLAKDDCELGLVCLMGKHTLDKPGVEEG